MTPGAFLLVSLVGCAITVACLLLVRRDTNRRLDQISAGLRAQRNYTMSALDDLTAAVQAEATVTASAVALLAGLKAKLDAAIAAGDPAKLEALSAELGAQTKALSDAVAANTPAAPPAPPAPPPPATP